MATLRQRVLSAAAIFAVALGASAHADPASAQSGGSGARSSGWQANEDDSLLLQLQVGSYQLTNDVRGYRTDRGVCLDLADVVQSLDLPIRIVWVAQLVSSGSRHAAADGRRHALPERAVDG